MKKEEEEEWKVVLPSFVFFFSPHPIQIDFRLCTGTTTISPLNIVFFLFF
jgi:hypothetical protein